MKTANMEKVLGAVCTHFKSTADIAREVGLTKRTVIVYLEELLREDVVIKMKSFHMGDGEMRPNTWTLKRRG